MSMLLNGSIDLTKLIEQANAKHSAFTKSTKNRHVYVAITQWINDAPNEHGQDSSFLLNSATKELNISEGKIYIGNAKKAVAGAGQPLEGGELPALDENAVATKETGNATDLATGTATPPVQDSLPF